MALVGEKEALDGSGVLNSSNLLTSEAKATDEVETVLVKSTDGKIHQMSFNSTQMTIDFALTGSGAKHHLTVRMDEIVTIRSSQVKLYGGLPKTVADDEVNTETPNILYIYYCRRSNVYIWRIREAAVLFTSTLEKKQWESKLQEAMQKIRARPEKLYIFINPFGGKGKAKSIYKKQVEPIFKMAGLSTTVIMTERQNHAYDVIQELDAEEWKTMDGVVSVGGDGLFNEVLCSVILRTQIDENKDIADVHIDNLATPKLRFGIIGAGSANSIVSSVHGVDDCPTAALHIAVGSRCSVDTCTVHQGQNLLRISANAISYGWLGDVLADSERFRMLGPVRYQYSALRTTIRNPSYFGRVSFALSPKNPEKEPKMLPCKKPCGICDGTEPKDPNLPLHWQTDFSHIICMVIPTVTKFSPYGLAPYTSIGDGSLDLAMVDRVSRCKNLMMMGTISVYGGKALVTTERRDAQVYRVNRWSFTPAAVLESKTEEEAKQGMWNLDGELLIQPVDKTLNFRLHPRLIHYFGRELDLDDPRYQKCFCCHSPKKWSNLVVLG
ncbi:Ceramide kinase 1 [Aphelenchoides besseyi]|nr:Ceramide kinase 1 [Aphelenchoides besseyi]KAI6208124.1 Ceramide kinase 1 [Aphelenchoides besseyi]